MGKAKLNSIKRIIFRTLINSYTSYDQFVLVNNVIREYDDAEEGIKNLKTSTVHQRFESR